jgi:hypothetical protein
MCVQSFRTCVDAYQPASGVDGAEARLDCLALAAPVDGRRGRMRHCVTIQATSPHNNEFSLDLLQGIWNLAAGCEKVRFTRRCLSFIHDTQKNHAA